MKKTLFITLLLVGPFMTKSALAQGNSQAGGLPALAELVANLQAQVQNLQAQVDALGGSGDPYVGDYLVIQFENNQFGCNNTNDPSTVLGQPGGLLQYLQPQGISSTAAFSSARHATADGSTLTVDSGDTVRHELRLSGTFETSSFFEDTFSIDIGTNGELLFDDPESLVIGQMADDGSTFTALARGIGTEGDCTDAYTIMIVGVRL